MSSKIITTRVELEISVARDVTSPEGTRRIRASSAKVLGEIGAQTPPLAEGLAVSLGTRTVGGSSSWDRIDCHGDSVASLGVLDPSPCAIGHLSAA